MRTRLQQGFAVMEVVVLVVLLAGIAAAGYLVYQRGHQPAGQPTALQQVEQASTPAAPNVEDTKDLDTATKTLDNTNLDASTSDSAELDAELSRF